MPDEATPGPLEELEADEAAALDAQEGDEEQVGPEVSQETEEEIDWRSRHEELSRRIGQQGNELGQLRQALAERDQMLQQYQQIGQPQQAQPQAQQGQELPVLTQEQWEEWQEQDPASAHMYLADLRVQQAEQAFNERLGKLEGMLYRQQAGGVVDQLRKEYGDDFIHQHSGEVNDLLKQYGPVFANEQNQGRMLRLVLDGLRYRNGANDRPRDEGGRFAPSPQVAGGSNGRTAQRATLREVDPDLAEMTELGRSDAFGALPPVA